MKNTKVYIYHTDPGHGWLAVKNKELHELGIADKISNYSYVRGATVYLEEDCDMALFVNALKAANKDFKCRDSYQERTPIRGYERYVAQ